MAAASPAAVRAAVISSSCYRRFVSGVDEREARTAHLLVDAIDCQRTEEGSKNLRADVERNLLRREAWGL